MTTSGTSSYSVTAQEVITQSLELLGVLGEGEEPNTAQMTTGLKMLNMIFKNWQANGLNLFAVDTDLMFLEEGQNTHTYYVNGGGGTPILTRAIETTMLSALNSGQTAVQTDPKNVTRLIRGESVDSFYFETDTSTDTNFTMGTVGISEVLTDGAFTLSSSLSSNLVEDEKVWIARSNGTDSPMKVLEAYLVRPDGSEIPVKQIPRSEYYSLTNKDSQGEPTQIYYERNNEVGTLRIWPTPNSQDGRFLRLRVQRYLDTFLDFDDTPDLPQEWFLPLVYNLAVYEAPKYGIPDGDFNRLERKALDLYNSCFDFDNESGTSLHFQPDTWQYYRY